MLTLLPAEEPPGREGERLVRVRLAVAMTTLGGWVVVGWRGAAPTEMTEWAQWFADDATGVVRVVEVDVPMLTTAALAEKLTEEEGETPC